MKGKRENLYEVQVTQNMAIRNSSEAYRFTPYLVVKKGGAEGEENRKAVSKLLKCFPKIR